LLLHPIAFDMYWRTGRVPFLAYGSIDAYETFNHAVGVLKNAAAVEASGIGLQDRIKQYVKVESALKNFRAIVRREIG
jgi:hypothetical protein